MPFRPIIASTVASTPGGFLTATNVQGALDQLVAGLTIPGEVAEPASIPDGVTTTIVSIDLDTPAPYLTFGLAIDPDSALTATVSIGGAAPVPAWPADPVYAITGPTLLTFRWPFDNITGTVDLDLTLSGDSAQVSGYITGAIPWS